MTTATETSQAVSDLLRLSTAFGASTGFMDELRDDWVRLLRSAEEISLGAVELSALSVRELPGLADLLLRDGVPSEFDHVTVHGPAKGVWGDDATLARRLAALPPGIEGIVMHPDVLAAPEMFRPVGGRLLLENMDPGKSGARTVDELLPYFDALPEAGFCFDIAHAWLVDPSLRSAHDLLDAFSERLREVHVSSILPSGRHIPLRALDAKAFRPVLDRCRHVPWILEAPLSA